MTKTLVERLREFAKSEPPHRIDNRQAFTEAASRIEELERHLTGMCDAYELLCQQSGMLYYDSPTSKYAAARSALSVKG